MVRTIGGFPVFPVDPGLIDATIFRPEYGGTGLLGDEGERFAPVRANFAGGMLEGFQIDPVTMMPRLVKPSGLFTADPNAPRQPEAKQTGSGRGAFTISDLMEMQLGMNQANFGTLEPETVFQYFDAKDDGTFDLKENPGGQFSQYLFSEQTTGEGDSARNIPLHEAINLDTGQPIGKERAVYLIKKRLAGIDESGGMDGGEGDGGVG